MALAQVGSAGRGGRVAIAHKDRLLRESLAMALAEGGLRILEFAGPEDLLAHIEAGADLDALVVDDAVSEADDTPRARLRTARCVCPVIVLSAPVSPGGVREVPAVQSVPGVPGVRGVWGDAARAAQAWGAVGVIDGSQPLAIVKRGLMNALRAGVLLGETGDLEPVRRHGALVFSDSGAQVSWKDCYLDLSGAERALLSGLVAAPAPGLSYQRAQAILAALDAPGSDGGRGATTQSGSGDGVGGIPGRPLADRLGAERDRVRALVRRLRKKFREVDPDFDRIVMVPGCGYGWRDGNGPAGDSGGTPP